TVAAALLVSSPLLAQTMDHAHMNMGDKQSTVPSPAAQKQIAAVEAAVRAVGTEAAATSDGFQPVFGWIPTMGVHWVKRPLMTKAMQSDRAAPSNLMFSKINGRDSLVGAAYA